MGRENRYFKVGGLRFLQALTPRERCSRFIVTNPSGPLSRHRERGWGERADAPVATLGAILCAVRIDLRLPPQINPYPAQPATGVLGQSPKRVLWYRAPGGTRGPLGKGGAAERWRVAYPIGIATRHGAKPATTHTSKRNATAVAVQTKLPKTLSPPSGARKLFHPTQKQLTTLPLHQGLNGKQNCFT